MKSVLKLAEVARPEASRSAQDLKSSMESLVKAVSAVENAGHKTGNDGLLLKVVHIPTQLLAYIIALAVLLIA